MSDQAKLKESVKKTIRGLVVSAPLGLTPREVEQDYRSFMGCPLPYRQLGYNTCQDFLQDIPDTILPQWERGHLIVRVVGGGDSIRRIQSLVSRQKVDVVKCLKKRRGAARAGTRIQCVQRDGNSPWRPGVEAGQTRASLPSIAFNSRPNARGPPAVTPAVPAYVRNQIKTLLIAHPNGVMNTEFDRLFEEKFGHTICCTKLGFESLGHMCQMLSDFVSLEKVIRGEFRIYEKTNHPSVRSPEVNVPGLKQVLRENKDSSILESRKLPLATNSLEQKRSNNFQQNVVQNGPIHSQTKSQRSPSQNADFANSTRQSDSERPPEQQAPDTRPKIPSNSSVLPGSSNYLNASAEASKLTITSDLFETKFLLEIRQILEQHPEGLWASFLPDEYKKLFKKALPMMSLGYYSVTELMANMPEVVVIEREQKQGDWKLYDVRTYKPKTVESTKPIPTPQTRGLKKSSTDPSHDFLELKDNVHRLLEKRTEGIQLKNMAFYYEREFGKTFPVKELGFRDVESLIMMMPETATVVYKGYGRLLVIAVEEESLKQKGSIPADAVAWGFGFNYCAYPPIREYIEVFVATVFTPHRISIQLKEKQRNDALDDLMDELESIYAYPEGNKYEFPETMVAVGQVCCALYLSDNNWHRGLITGIPNVDFIEVLYVDYGTIANVTRSSLRLLKSCFLRLPIQAFNARLAYIAPVEDKWTKESRDMLLSLTAGKPLIALITKIQSDMLYLLLSDTTTAEDVHINDALMEAGLARFDRPEGELNEDLPPLLTEDECSDLETLRDVVATETDVDGQHQKDEEVPSVPKEEAEMKPPSCEEGASSIPPLEMVDDLPWLIKCIDLDDGKQAHLINHDNEACLCVAEVASLMCKEEESEPEEILIQQVRVLGVEIPLLTSMEKDNPRLFEEMRRFELLDRSDDSPDRMAMIPFTDALLLLSACDRVSMEVIQQLQEKSEALGVFGDMFGCDIGDTAGDDLDLMLDPEELKTILEALQFRRKRILDAMMKNTDSNSVDELLYIERKLEEISKRYRETLGL